MRVLIACEFSGTVRRAFRATCICIHCRVRPARYYGPVDGYAVGCDECLDAMAAKRRARK